jgi:hypothetical protein
MAVNSLQKAPLAGFTQKSVSLECARIHAPEDQPSKSGVSTLLDDLIDSLSRTVWCHTPEFLNHPRHNHRLLYGFRKPLADLLNSCREICRGLIVRIFRHGLPGKGDKNQQPWMLRAVFQRA